MAMKWSTLIEEKNGKVSAIRVGFLFALLMVMFNWSWVNYHKKTELAPFPENTVTLIVGLATAKAVQRFGEKKKETPIEKPVEKPLDNSPSIP